jgi:hypothetical protein
VTGRRLAVAFALGAALLPAAPARAGFSEVLHALEERYHVHESYPLLFGLARAAVLIARPEGVSDLQLATFEGQRLADSAGVAAIMRAHAGEGFQPIVQTWSRRSGGEHSLIYAHPETDGRVAMMIFAQDHEDTVLLRVVVSPEKFLAAVKDHQGIPAGLK